MAPPALPRREFVASGTKGHLAGHRLILLLAIVGLRPCHNVGQQVVETLKPTPRGMPGIQAAGRFAVVKSGWRAESRLLAGRAGRWSPTSPPTVRNRSSAWPCSAHLAGWRCQGVGTHVIPRGARRTGREGLDHPGLRHRQPAAVQRAAEGLRRRPFTAAVPGLVSMLAGYYSPRTPALRGSDARDSEPGLRTSRKTAQHQRTAPGGAAAPHA